MACWGIRELWKPGPSETEEATRLPDHRATRIFSLAINSGGPGGGSLNRRTISKQRRGSSPEKAGVGGSIPSLATILSISYRHSKNQFHSVSFQKLWSAEIRISDGTGRQDGFELLSIPPHFGLTHAASHHVRLSLAACSCWLVALPAASRRHFNLLFTCINRAIPDEGHADDLGGAYPLISVI